MKVHSFSLRTIVTYSPFSFIFVSVGDENIEIVEEKVFSVTQHAFIMDSISIQIKARNDELVILMTNT